MSFPRTPVDGQTTVTNNIVYIYNSNNRAWKKQFGTIAVSTATVTILDDSISPITGALTVPGGVSISRDLYAGGKIYTQGWEISTATYIQFNTATTLFNTATQSIKLIGGGQGSIPIQNSSDNTGFISIGPAGNVLQSNGTTVQWVTTSTGLGFGTSTATDVAFRLATTATNLTGKSFLWGNTLGGIPIQYPGSVAVGTPNGSNPSRPDISYYNLFTDYSGNIGSSGYVQLDITNPSNPIFWMANTPSTAPGPSGSPGPTGSTGPTGDTGSAGLRLNFQFPDPTNPYNPYLVGPAWLQNYTRNSYVWQMPYPGYNFNYIIHQFGVYIGGNYTYRAQGAPNFPFVINFPFAFNYTPYSFVLTHKGNDNGSQHGLNLTPLFLYATNITTIGFTINAVRQDNGAAYTGNWNSGYSNGAGRIDWWAIGQ
jgi:hypothetical protein